MSLIGMVSPYHLTTREAPAMAALLLCEQVVTMMPTPEGDAPRALAEQLAGRAPRYARLVESWSWSVPLWNESVIVSEVGGLSPRALVQEAHAEIGSRVDFAPLRPLLAEYPDDASYLQALAHDLLRGGPDPALTIPMAAGLDRFAAAHQLVMARSHPVSLAQRHEERLWRTLATLALPVILEGRAERVLDARELLDPELSELREQLLAVRAGKPEPALRSAGSAFRKAFDRVAPELVEPDPQEPRVVFGEVALRLVDMPADASLLASVRAAASIARVDAAPATAGLALAGARTTSLVVRVIARR